MNDPKRMEELKGALKLIKSASMEENRELFRRYLPALEKQESLIQEPENRFSPHSSTAYRAMDILEDFFRNITGYRASWVPRAYLKHCTENLGRSKKYSLDDRIVYCSFIREIARRGSSETQAIKLLMRLLGDKAESSGLLRELKDTYKDYKAYCKDEKIEDGIFDSFGEIPYFLKFTIDNLEGNEIASQKAVDAFRVFFSDLIILMKSMHELIAKEDSAYPKIFGCVIEWINSEYEDPLDYFYKHPSHETIDFRTRRRDFHEYLFSMKYYIEDNMP